jgi:pyruvate/2-oxoglutarate dehydrogenase complex dihydrolipoamide acyltransferase (E2) component
MICENCRQVITPIDHNHRGLRCPTCWERVVVEKETPSIEMDVEGHNGPLPEATPSACALAAEHGIDLANVQGSGSGGRITKRDVEALL